MYSGTSSDISKFADNTKIRRIIRLDFDAIPLQVDLDIMNGWTDKWQMQFDINKCRILSIGRGNPHYRYTINMRLLLVRIMRRFRS